MGIITIDERTFEEMMSKFEAFVSKVEALCKNSMDKRLKTRLDNQDVCEILNISKRTLQTYRERGLLPYSQVKYKIWYDPEDVEKLLKSSCHSKNSQ